MKNRVIIEQQLKEYPDVVSIAQCQRLLGGIGQATVMKLIKAKRLPSVFVKNQYLISKAGIIDFLVSGDYTETGCTAKQRREENERYKQMIVAYLGEYQKGQKSDVNRLLMPVLPANLTDLQKQHKVSKLLAALKREGVIRTDSPNQQLSHWVLTTNTCNDNSVQ